MTIKEKKEFLQHFLEQLWHRDILLVEEEQSDYGDGISNYHPQDEEEIIDWYLRNNR